MAVLSRGHNVLCDSSRVQAGVASTVNNNVNGAASLLSCAICRWGQLTSTVTFVGFVIISKTAERFCDCATSAAMSSSEASASMS